MRNEMLWIQISYARNWKKEAQYQGERCFLWQLLASLNNSVANANLTGSANEIWANHHRSQYAALFEKLFFFDDVASHDVTEDTTLTLSLRILFVPNRSSKKAVSHRNLFQSMISMYAEQTVFVYSKWINHILAVKRSK